MASYSADTDLARELAVTFLDASAGADDIGAAATSALGLSQLESDAPIRSDELSVQLNRGGVVVRQQADLLDGIDIDLTEFADQLDQDPDELAQQLQLIAELGLGAEAGILPLVLWEGTTVTPQTIGDVFVGLPAAGTDAEWDAVVARLDGWLLPLLQRTDDWDPRKVDLSDAQAADLALLGQRIGAGEHMIEFTERRQVRDNGDTEWRDFDVRTSALDAGGYRLLGFVRDAFAQDQATARLAGAPTFDDLLTVLVARNEAELARQLAELGRGGDKDQQRARDRTRQRLQADFDHLDPDALRATYGELDWLGAVLAGLEPPPADAASRQLLVDFANEVGYGNGTTFTEALTGLRNERLIQDTVVLGDPTNGRLIFNDEMVRGTVDFGLRSGAINDAMVADAQRVAEGLLGINMVDVLGSPNGIDLSAPPPELQPEAFVQALALRVDHEVLTENQVIAALAFVGSAETISQQLERMRDVLLSFQTVSVAGPPAFTTLQFERALGSDLWAFANSRSFEAGRNVKVGDDWITDYSHVPTHLDGNSEQWQWVMNNLGVPGYHKERWGRRRLHFGVDGTGAVAGFQVEKIQKRGWLRAVVLGVFTLAAGAFGQWYMVAALASMQGMEAYKEGGWVAALKAIAGTVILAAGGASLASWLAPSAAASAASAAVSTGGAYSSLAISASQGVVAGIGAHEAFNEGDLVGGLIHGTQALAVATGSGALLNVATVGDGVDQTVEGIEDSDVVGIVSGVAIAGSAGLNLAGDSGLVNTELAQDFKQASQALTGLGKTTVLVDATIEAIENDDIAGAVQNGLGAVSAAATIFAPGSAGAEVLSLSADQQGAIETLVNVTKGASTLTGAVDAARRDDVLGALSLLSQAVVDVEGGVNHETGADASLIAHHADQLRALIQVTEVLVNIDGDTTYTDLALGLAPTLTNLEAAGKPLPDDTPLAASPTTQGLLDAGEAVWDYFSPPVVDFHAPTNAEGTMDRLLVVVGGLGDVDAGDVRVDLVQKLQAENPNATIVYASWDAQDEVLEHIQGINRAYPEADVTFIGHSWGADTAIELAGASGIEGARLVTLDGVSWFPSGRPDNVADWINVPVPGINDVSDFVATIGGHWGPQYDAINIDAHRGLRPGDDFPTHGDPLELYQRYLDAFAPPDPGGPTLLFPDLLPNQAGTVDPSVFLDLSDPNAAGSTTFPPDFRPEFRPELSAFGPGGGPAGALTPAQQQAIVDLAFDEYVSALDDHIDQLAGQRQAVADQPVTLDGLAGQTAQFDQLSSEIRQLENRRGGLLYLQRQPGVTVADFEQFDGTRFVIDSNADASQYYLGEVPGLGPDEPLPPAVLGPNTRQDFLVDAKYQHHLGRLVTGISPQPGEGAFAIDLEDSEHSYHVGRTQVSYHTYRSGDGELTTVFSSDPRDGLKDVLEVGPIEERYGDDLGPNLEVPGARPSLYEPFRWQVTYPDHNQPLIGNNGLPVPGNQLLDFQSIHDPFAPGPGASRGTTPGGGPSLGSGPAAGPIATTAFFDYSLFDRTITGVAGQAGPVSGLDGLLHEEQLGVNGDTTTHLERDGTITQIEVKATAGSNPATAIEGGIQRERRAGEIGIHTAGPGLDGEATGEFDTIKYEAKLDPAGGRPYVVANHTEGLTEVDYRHHQTEADGTITSEEGRRVQRDRSIKFGGGREGTLTGANEPVSGGITAKVNGELGLTHVTEERSGIITNSGRPDAHSELTGRVDGYAIDGLGFFDVRGQGAVDMPGRPGPSHGERGGGTFTSTVYEEQTETLDHFEHDVDVGQTRRHVTRSPVHSSSVVEDDLVDGEGDLVSSRRQTESDGPLTDAASDTTLTVGPDGSSRIEASGEQRSILGDESVARRVTYQPGAGAVDRTEVHHDGYLFDTTTTTTTTTDELGSTSTTTAVHSAGPLRDTIETESDVQDGHGLP